MNKKTLLIILIVILLALAGGVYWYLFFYSKGSVITQIKSENTNKTNGFSPLTTGLPSINDTSSTTPVNVDQEATTTVSSEEKLPALRLLSDTPIGGYGASTTASTTVVRWIDRGRGNIFEADNNSLEIKTISNTVLPRIYESVWNKNSNSFIGSMLSNDSEIPKVVYAQLRAQTTPTKQKTTSTTTSTSTESSSGSTSNLTPFSLKGKNFPENILNYAVSPKGDKIFMLVKENGSGTGYTANFDGSSIVKIFSTPLTQVNIEWPEENTIAITTKGTSSQIGFLYFVNPKTGVWKKILGPTYGLSTKVSHDAKFVFASGSGKNGVITANIYPVGTTTPLEATVTTLADKCAWGNFYKEILYCAVSSQVNSGNYPDDWYKGNISSSDKIWQINVLTNQIHLVSSTIEQSNRIINVFNLGLDPKDNFLFFMNKEDLSFWSFDLNSEE